MSDMDKPGVAYVQLYRSSKDWRTTIAEVPLALACGSLPTTAREAPFEEAAREFEAILREFYDGIPDALDWRETDPDWWAANVSGEAPETSAR
jgi:hypothetical protein